MKPTRVIYWLRWSVEYRAWMLTRGPLVLVPLTKIKVTGEPWERPPKREMMRRSRVHCRNQWKTFGELCQLRICNLKGRVSEENTYGRDPRKYKG